MNFTNTDALLASVGSMDVYGHTLGWHSQQNATYLKDSSGLTVIRLLLNWPQTLALKAACQGWSIFNSMAPLLLPLLPGNSDPVHQQ
ncbi:MAG: hypothetical protein IPM85_00190 [Chitinophagaceae bacterium]|nr:hypothetical protein [Chitinophagaceae bacterium]